MCYTKFVDSEIKAAKDVQTWTAGRAVLDCFEKKWEQMANAYAELEIASPEPNDQDHQAPEPAVDYILRRVQWESAIAAHDRGYRAIVDRIAALRAAAESENRAEPTRRQQMEMAARKRHWLYIEIRRRVERLGEDVTAEQASIDAAALECFGEEHKAIRVLINQLDETANAAHKIDQEAYDDARNTVDGQVRRIAQDLNPVEKELARLARTCRRNKAI